MTSARPATPDDRGGTGADTPPLAELGTLAAVVTALRFPLAIPGAERARVTRDEVLAQLRDYVIPRYRALGAPVLAVVGGSTGAGKSTLVNTLVGRVVSRSSAVRPTTRNPVLVHHPTDATWFTGPRILPRLPRVHEASARGTGGSDGLVLVSSPRVGPGLALLDAPDVDSVVDANRRLAGQLLAAADLWIFVTSAHRYADAVPWALLRAAAARDAVVAVVLDRVSLDILTEVRPDLEALLAREGLAAAPLFTVLESALDAEGLLSDDVVAQIRSWLDGLSGDATARERVVRRTLDGALAALTDRVWALAAAADAQVAEHARLRAGIAEAYRMARDRVVDATADGTVLRGEVLARWQEFVGTGELLRSLQGRVGALRDRVVAAVRGRPQPAAAVQEAIQEGLAALLLSQVEAAADGARAALMGDPAGRDLVGERDVARLPEGFDDRVAREIRAWQDDLLALVRTEGQTRRTTARLMAFGVNGVGVTLMVVAFASTGGLVGAEIGIAGGAAVVGQKVLEAVFGDHAVRRLAAEARDALQERCDRILADEEARIAALLDDAAVDPGAGGRVRDAVEATRRAAAVPAGGPDGDRG